MLPSYNYVCIMFAQLLNIALSYRSVLYVIIDKYSERGY